MKIAYTILAFTLISLAVAFSGTDHGSQAEFSAQLRATGHFAQK